MTHNDQLYMKQALMQAKIGYLKGEVPVGCVITVDDQVIAETYNQPISLHDATAHAEILAIRKAGQALSNYRLLNTTLYVTLEPCAMCAGAIVHARIKRLVFAACDLKTGMVCSCGRLLDRDGLNHKVQWKKGVLFDESALLLKNFFQERR